jgi:hydroxyethylthiazole kinase-like uncharacterized protein yjeF
MKMISVDKMKELERLANEDGLSFDSMMKSAGSQLAKFIESRYSTSATKRIVGLIGGGKNGSDTLLAMAELQNTGWSCLGIKVTDSTQPDWVMEIAKTAGCEVVSFNQLDQRTISKVLENTTLILDGILGTGFHAPLKPDLQRILEYFSKKSKDKLVVAVDCPSGVDCSTSFVSPGTIKAEITVCMEAVKQGLLNFPAFEYCGEIVCVEIGLVAHLSKHYQILDEVIQPGLVKSILPKRSADSHKGTFGTLIVCGGNVNYPGAPILCTKSAYKVGAGLVKTAIPERIYEAVVPSCLESTWILLDDENGVISDSAATLFESEISKATCVVLGSGIGQEETTQRFLKKTLFKIPSSRKKNGVGFAPSHEEIAEKLEKEVVPFLIDADGLRLLAKLGSVHDLSRSKFIFTPHPGEMSALTGLSVEQIQSDRVEIARKYAQEWGQVVVLKGALTVVASADGKVAVCPIANSALAKAGSGDVLAGVIGGFIAQGLPLFDAAIAGVWLHATSGVFAAQQAANESSVMASDLITQIPEVMGELNK